MEKQRRKLEEYLQDKDKKEREEMMKEKDDINKRLKIEKKKQEQLEYQRKMLQHYREKKQETENLLRISSHKKSKLNTSTPEYQFNDSYMKRRIMKHSNSKPRDDNNRTDMNIKSHSEVDVHITQNTDDENNNEYLGNVESNDVINEEKVEFAND